MALCLSNTLDMQSNSFCALQLWHYGKLQKVPVPPT